MGRQARYGGHEAIGGLYPGEMLPEFEALDGEGRIRSVEEEARAMQLKARIRRAIAPLTG